MNQGAGAELQVRVSEAFSGERRRRVWPASGGVAIPPPPPPTEFCPTAAKNKCTFLFFALILNSSLSSVSEPELVEPKLLS